MDRQALQSTTVAVRETPGSRIFAGSCTVVQSVRHFTTTACASRRTTVCVTKRAVNDDGVCEQAYDRVCETKRAVNDDGVCEQAYDRVCDVSGGQRRRRMRAGVRPCVQRNGRSTTTAYASRRTTVCNVTGGRQQRRMRAGVRACVRRIGRSTTTS